MSAVREFDYIVVGAGSAGCVLGARLSEQGSRVLLLEAGAGDDHWLLRMPLGFLRAMTRPEFSWSFMSEPEPHLNGRSLWLPRGRVLGGSGSINGMLYMRGHPKDFEDWRALGAEGWGYADVLPYFRRMETSWRGANEYHGDRGPLPVNPIDTRRLLHEPLMQTATAAGFEVCDDLNARAAEGFARAEVTIDNRGRRASSARVYLRPALRRRNLILELGALTTQVLTEGGRATGVEYVQNGQKLRARARNEVILSAGTYKSPQLLMLSGIGPAEELHAHGIAVVLDLPGVGRNLSEHPCVPLEFAAARPVTFLNQLRADRAAWSMLRWKLFGTGPMASQINSCNIIVRTRLDLDRPDVQISCNPMRMDARIWFPGFAARQAHRLFVEVVVLHQKSRGFVRLRSANPSDAPRITTNVFADPEDFATARRGIKVARRIYGTEPQARYVDAETLPGAGVTSQADLDTYIRDASVVTQHPVGTCRMGRGSDAVVDAQLRVRGIEGLRVVDASVLPTAPGGTPNATVMMVAERAADLILGRAPMLAVALEGVV